MNPITPPIKLKAIKNITEYEIASSFSMPNIEENKNININSLLPIPEIDMGKKVIIFVMDIIKIILI